MKNLLSLLSLFLIAFQVFAASDWSPPSPNATINGKLTVNSTSKASRPYPSMTTAQRDAVTATEGETIFNSTTGKLNIYSNAKWGEVSGSGGGSGGIDFLTGQNFDSGVSAWTGSGTFTATTTALGAGANWSLSATGTRELVVNTSSYSGSQVWASIYVNSTDTNLSFCVVTTYENCAKNTSEAGWKKLQVQFTATSTATLKLKSLSSSFAGYFAAVKIEPFTPQAVNLVEQGEWAANTWGGNVAGNYLPYFSNVTINTTNGLFSVVSNSTDGTKLTALKNIVLSGSANSSQGALDAFSGFVKNDTSASNIDSINPPTRIAISAAGTGSRHSTTSFVGLVLSAGETVKLKTTTQTSDTNARWNISFHATAISDNVVQTWQDGTEWTSYTPTFANFGSPTNINFKYRREGSDLLIQGFFTPSAVSATIAGVYLPNGLTIASGLGALNQVVGSVSPNSLNSAGYKFNVLAVGGEQLIRFGESSTNNGLTSINSNLFAQGVSISLNARIPIQGWSSAPTLYALPTRSEVFSANISASGVATNATQNFVTSCTNATPSVCSLWSSFGVAPICESHTVDITKRAEVTASTATTTTVARTDTSTAFNLFCHLK